MLDDLVVFSSPSIVRVAGYSYSTGRRVTPSAASTWMCRTLFISSISSTLFIDVIHESCVVTCVLPLLSEMLRSHEQTSDLVSSSMPSSYKSITLPVTSPNSKLSMTSPKRGQKREDGWKEVVRR